MFPVWQVPVAYSMVALANGAALINREPFQSYMCYWSAFNNIYVVLAEREGNRATLRRSNGQVQTRRVANVDVPEVTVLSERKQLDIAFLSFSDELKRYLVTHESTRFFVNRVPHWQDKKIERDARNQRLNGVLNVGRTVDVDNPVWSPIDREKFEWFQVNQQSIEVRDELAKQILDVLYTVRNNTFHGAKRADDADDAEVVQNALPLLREIVESFLEDKEHIG